MSNQTDIRKAIADLLRHMADGVERLPMPTLGADPTELVPVVHKPDRVAAREGKFPACIVGKKLMAKRGDLLTWQASRSAAVPSAPSSPSDDEEYERFVNGGRRSRARG